MTTPRIQAGDLIAVPFADSTVAVGLVLQRSTGRLKGCLLVGFYDHAFDSADNVAAASIHGPFISTPQYLHQWAVRKGVWPVISHRDDLLAITSLPILRMSYDLYRGDEHVGRVTSGELQQYPELIVRGDGSVVDMLRRHFSRNSASLTR